MLRTANRSQLSSLFYHCNIHFLYFKTFIHNGHIKNRVGKGAANERKNTAEYRLIVSPKQLFTRSDRGSNLKPDRQVTWPEG